MRASRLSTRPESCGGVGAKSCWGVGATAEVEGAVLGAVLAHAAATGAGRGSAAGIGVPGPNGRRSAC
eukprot:4760706-Pleurochrysis_carterae.AAC.2